jgi:DNA polymerase
MSAPYKQIVTIDFETYWDTASGYTLSKMTTEEYIRHERFKVFGACLHVYGSDGIVQWYRGDELHRVLRTFDWGVTAILAHNAQFDVSILEWTYDIHPCFIFDTLSMARALRGVEVGNSLARLARDFGLPDKGTAIHSTNGVHELAPALERDLAEYCQHDVFLCEEIFKRLAVSYPSKELRLIDMTLKMYTHPVLELDANMLTDALHDEKEKREALLERLELTDSVLASNVHFAEALRNVGIEPPTKKKKPTVKTPHPVGTNFAFAKTDAMFQAMLNGDNEDVAALCEARLKVKSTTERTRAQRFLDIAGRGTLPVPLSYYGAATGRWTASKGSAINMQNLKRGSFLRKAIMAPKGHQLVVGDLSQIEPRVLAWLADYEELLRIFVAGGDPYAQFGAQMFNIPGLTKESHPDLRQSAKSALLGAGYGLGWASFASQLLVGFLGAPPVRYERKFAKALGVTSEDVEKFLDNEDYVAKMLEIPHICT